MIYVEPLTEDELREIEAERLDLQAELIGLGFPYDFAVPLAKAAVDPAAAYHLIIVQGCRDLDLALRILR